MRLRKHLPTVIIAVVASAVTAGAPAIAHGVQHALFAHNSDKVDGKHAVGAGATVNKRKGKLVATKATTGRLPNNIIAKAPDANKLDGINSSGFLRGVRMRTGTPFTVSRNSFNDGTASCAGSEQATGGGVFPNSNVFFPNVVGSYPTPNPFPPAPPNNGVVATGWTVWVSNPDVGGLIAPTTVTMTPYVLCVGPAAP
jgi:hypothetical protein